MKILQVFDFFTPLGGGTVDAIYKLSKKLVRMGHEVTIFTSDYKLDRSYISSLPEVKIKIFHNSLTIFGFYFIPGIIEELKNNLKEFDVIHLQCARSFQNIIIHHYAKKYDIPYVLDTHGSLPRTIGKDIFNLKKYLKWIYDITFGYRVYRDAARAIAESDIGVSEYRQYGVGTDKIVKIPSPIDTDEFRQLPPLGLFKKEYNLEKKHIIMFLGRIHKIKGLDFIVDSFADIANSRDDLILVIVGNDDGYKQALVKRINKLKISEKVLFTGFLGGQSKLKALVDASMIIQASMYEQGVRVAIEAILCNVPVIVTKNTGPGEFIERIDGGYLIEYGNKNQLTHMILHVLNQRHESILKTLKAKEYIERNLTVENGAKKFLELYEQLI